MAQEVVLWITFALYKGQWEDPLHKQQPSTKPAFLANEKLQGLCVAVFMIYSSPSKSPLCPYLNLLLNISFCKFKESPLFFQKGFRFVSQQYTRCINIRKNTVRVSCTAPKSSDLSLKLSWTFSVVPAVTSGDFVYPHGFRAQFLSGFQICNSLTSPLNKRHVIPIFYWIIPPEFLAETSNSHFHFTV